VIHHLLIFWQRKLEDSYHENLRLQTKLEESDRINRELLALSNRQASTIRSLTKAGDVMADFISPNPTAEMWGEEQAIKQAWENAKEDTQS
jgi:hypothetical protein